MKKAIHQGLFKAGDLQFDFAKIQERKSDIVSKSSKGVDYLLKKNKVAVIRGEAKLLSPGKIQVTDGAAVSEVEAKNIVIATGSEARSLPGYDVDEQHIISNIGALDMSEVPEALVIVGAGAVGVEFASIYNAFGSKVTLLEVAPDLMPLEDAEVSKELRRVLGRKGIEIYTKAKLESAKSSEEGVEVLFQTEAGEAKKVLADKILMATGRSPNSGTIGLGSIGVALDRRFIKVNSFMQTNVPGIYAIGDVVPTPLLAHVAFQEGVVAVEKIAGHNPTPINYLQVPNCTYSDPLIASIGLTEAKAVAAGFKIKTGKFPFMAVGKARIADATDGFVKIVADEAHGEILGVHMIGEGVTENIHEAVAAMGLEGTVADLVHAVHAHPTMAEGMHEALESVFGAAIHI
jgi:dihydrolipoamide dehydrogenase